MSATPQPATLTGPQDRRTALRNLGLGALLAPAAVAALAKPANAQTVATVTERAQPAVVTAPAPSADTPPYTLKVVGKHRSMVVDGEYYRDVSLTITGHDKHGEAFSTKVHVSHNDKARRPYVGRIVFRGYYEENGVRTGEPIEDYGLQEFSPGVPGKGSGTRFKANLSPEALAGMQVAAAAILKKATALLDRVSPADQPPATPREVNIANDPAAQEIARDAASFYHALSSRVKPRTASAG